MIYNMKIIAILLMIQFGTIQINAQAIAINKMTTFSYDLNGNITSRKGISTPSLKPNDGNNRIDISGDISIIGKDNKNVTKWASSVPMWGKHVAPSGHG